MIPMNARSTIPVTSRVAWVQQARRCVGKYFGLRGVGKPASYADAPILQVLERGLYVVPHPVSQCQIVGDPPVILCIRIVLRGPDIHVVARSLVVGRWNAKHKIC